MSDNIAPFGEGKIFSGSTAIQRGLKALIAVFINQLGGSKAVSEHFEIPEDDVLRWIIQGDIPENYYTLMLDLATEKEVDGKAFAQEFNKLYYQKQQLPDNMQVSENAKMKVFHAEDNDE